MMTNRERVKAILNYENYDRMPVVHFGFWEETLQKWAKEGHISKQQAKNWTDGNMIEFEITEKLGFDFNWLSVFHATGTGTGLWPGFEPEVVKEMPDGSKHILNEYGVITLQMPNAAGIPPDIEHTLKDRQSWEQHYKPRLKFDPDRINKAQVNTGKGFVSFEEGGMEFLKTDDRDFHYGLECGSLFGQMRNWLGLENTSYLYFDDAILYKEIIDTVAQMVYQCVEHILKTGAKFDFAHFWEDICFKNGPLVTPAVFNELVGPHYKRITGLLNQYGVNIVSLDCDGVIDTLIPTWLDNGVNTMFPIEVGTWNASIAPWREKFGKDIRGVGGMKKHVFALDKSAVDAEIERLKPLVELGGYIPCPDHRIAPDAKWDNVRYYCDQMNDVFQLT